MAKYHKDKSFRVTVVSGTTTTGLYAKDGSTNVVDAAIASGAVAATFDSLTALETTLSNGDLTATHSTANANTGVCGNRALNSGKFYFEITRVNVSSTDGIGLITSTGTYGNVLAGSNCTVVYSASGNITSNNAPSGKSIGGISAGEIISIAVDLTARKAWFRRSGGNWNGLAIGSENPATGLGGVIVAPTVYFLPVIAYGAVAGGIYTANFGATAFTYPVPAGFELGWPPATATPLTWGPETATAVTLSNGNMTATSTGTTSADQGVRVSNTKGKTSGKFYFEVTWTTLLAGANIGIGIGTTASTYTNMGTSGTVGNIIYRSGTIYNNGSSSGVTITPRASGDIIAVAADIDNRRIWFRLSPTGNWNNNPAANPATNSGGMVIPAGTMVPFCTFGGAGGVAGSVATSNFGTSAFSGAVPSGYSAGWPEPSGSGGSGSGLVGAYHRCGGLNVIRTTAPVHKLRAPNGALYVTTTPYANRGTKITIVSGTLS